MSHHDPDLENELRALPELAPDPAFRQRVLAVASATRQERPARLAMLWASAENRAFASGFLCAVALSVALLAAVMPRGGTATGRTSSRPFFLNDTGIINFSQEVR